MRTQQLVFTPQQGWNTPKALHQDAPDFVWILGGRAALQDGTALRLLAEMFDRARFFGCSTAGEIDSDARVYDDHVVATAVWFDRSHVDCAVIDCPDGADARAVGRELGKALKVDGLVHAIVFSDGTRMNGSALASGLEESLPAGVTLSGGLAGDGAAMQETVVVHAGDVRGSRVSIMGFYGDVRVAIGTLSGWAAFGPERRITSSSANVLSTLDGEEALSLYKRYLGPHAATLPAGALLFPLLVKADDGTPPVVRTVLSIDDAAGTMTFAGDVPVGASAHLMRANFDRVVAGAAGAAQACLDEAPVAELALLVSCVGRKLLLKQRIEEEVEAVRDVMGAGCVLAGFYSYGELAPTSPGKPCQLHNETMTVTTFRE